MVRYYTHLKVPDGWVSVLTYILPWCLASTSEGEYIYIFRLDITRFFFCHKMNENLKKNIFLVLLFRFLIGFVKKCKDNPQIMYRRWFTKSKYFALLPKKTERLAFNKEKFLRRASKFEILICYGNLFVQFKFFDSNIKWVRKALACKWMYIFVLV